MNFNFFSSINIIQLNFLRFFSIKGKRIFRQLNSLFKFYFGYTFYDILDSFSVASLQLVFIKLLIRLFGYNFSWQINFSLLMIFTFFNLFFSIIVIVRKYVRKIWRGLLPPNFFHRQNVSEIEDDNIKFIYHEISKKQEFYLNFLFFLILIRLFILSEPYLFLLFNFGFTFVLVSNNYLIFSSIISILLAASRWTFLLQNNTTQDFKLEFSRIVSFEKDESFYPSWENAQTVGIFIVRYLSEISEQNYSEAWKRNLDLQFATLFIWIAERYLELNHPIVNKSRFLLYEYLLYPEGQEKIPYNQFSYHPSGMHYFIQKSTRDDFLNDLLKDLNEKKNKEKIKELFKNIYIKKKKNSYFYVFLILLFFFVINAFLFNSPYTHDTWYENSPRINLPRFSQIPSTDLRKPTHVAQIMDPKIAPSILADLTAKESEQLISKKSANHPQYIEKYEDGTFANFTLTHIRSLTRSPDLLKTPMEIKTNFPIKAFARNTSTKKIRDENIAKEIFERHSKISPEIKKGFSEEITIVTDNQRISELKKHATSLEINTFEHGQKQAFASNLYITEHINFSESRLLVFDKTVSLDDAKNLVTTSYEYCVTICQHPYTTKFQKMHFKSREFELTQQLLFLNKYGKKISENHFATKNHPFISSLCTELSDVTKELQKDIKQNPFVIEILYRSNLENKPFDEIREEFSNIDHLPKLPPADD